MASSDHCVYLSTISSASKRARPTQRASVHMCCHAARDVMHSSSVPKSALHVARSLESCRAGSSDFMLDTSAMVMRSVLHAMNSQCHRPETTWLAACSCQQRLQTEEMTRAAQACLMSSHIQLCMGACVVHFSEEGIYLRCLSAAAAASNVRMVLISSGTDSKYRQTWHASPTPHIYNSHVHHKR